MLQLEGYVEIQVLRRQGKSIRAISAELGVARNTVRKYLRAERAPRSKPRPARASKLDAFRPYLQERVRQAHPQWIPASVLEREIRERGYTGKGAILRAYMSTLKPRAPEDPVVRFETAPAEQVQVDWATRAMPTLSSSPTSRSRRCFAAIPTPSSGSRASHSACCTTT